MINRLFKTVLFIIIVSIIITTGAIIITIGAIKYYTISPVEESTTRNDSIVIKINDLDSIRHENIKKAINLNDSDTVELFKWLLSR